MARIERGEKIVETGKALVVPVKLLVGALQKTVFGEKLRFRLARKRYMRR